MIFAVAIFFISCGDSGVNDPDDGNGNDVSLTEIPAIEEIVMYEVNFRTLESPGFAAVTAKLDHIKSLGVNVIWLMPIYPIGEEKSVNSPYAVQNYKEVNPEFGTIDDFRKLVDAAHSNGMAVILDWVANHTAWDNPWIANEDWYTQNSSGEIIHPPGTNWQDVADLNFNNAEMRTSMIDALQYWVTEHKIDGYRCDAADFVPFDFWQDAIQSLNSIENRDLILLAEGARTDHFTAGFQLNYSWDFYNQLKNIYVNASSAGSIFSTHANEYATVPNGKHRLRFITNHDESAWDATPVELFGGLNGSLSTFVISTYLGGVPLIYGSQEVGEDNTISFFNNDPINWNQNSEILDKYKSIMNYYVSSTSLKTGSLTSYSNNDIVVFTRKSGDEEILVMVNTRNRSKSLNLPSALQNTTWKEVFSETDLNLGTTFSFNSFQYFVCER
ncbi:MAG: alpha-glucosidase C-terminal domain-containing protein [Melioribacteraceae bacterium]|nr:alpha-glucosidase C-terminal domain-containing protein [Melioribacteraceae bacterium]